MGKKVMSNMALMGQPDERTVRSVTIEYGQYLSTVMTELPAGLVNKNVTGAGATYLEFESERSSIIVFPTRALAATKAQKHGTYYIGSDYGEVTATPVEEIVHDMDSGKRIKVAVVVDSLSGLLTRLGRQAYDYFHLTIDEADCLQSEFNYRPRMELGLEEYLKFPENRRTMVSATLQEFSHADLANEPVTDVEWLGKPADDLFLFHEYGDIVCGVITYIRQLRKFFPGYKILIAYNSVSNAQKIAEFFREHLRGEIGILCSEKSEENLPSEFHGGLNNGHLKHAVTIMTSAYFYGIDIEEELCMMIVADVHKPHTLLSEEKIQQVFGRARPGCKVKAILFNSVHATKNPFDLVDIDVFQTAIQLQELVIDIDSVPNNIFSDGYKRQIISSLLQGSKVLGLELVRQTDDGFTISSLAIDHLKQIQRAMADLYHDPWTAMDTLAWDYYVELNESENEISERDRESLADIFQKAMDVDKERAISFANQLKDEFTITFLEPKNSSEEKMNRIVKIVRDNQNLKRKYFHEALLEVGKKTGSKGLNWLWRIAELYKDYPSGNVWRQLHVHFERGKSYHTGQIAEAMGILKDTTRHPSFEDKEWTEKEYLRFFNKIFLTSIDKRANPGRNSYRLKSERSNEIMAE